METTISSQVYEFKVRLNAQFLLFDKIARTTDLVKMATECGLKPGTDYLQFHQLYDLAEATLNDYLTTIHFPDSLSDVLEVIKNHTKILPSFTERSSDKSLYQQFSTPSAIAWILVQLAGIKPGDYVLEPSAGTGSISCLIKRTVASSIMVNEIHPFRHWLLTDQGYHHLYKEDATQIHNMPKFRVLLPDKIILNPPFSRSVQTKGKVDILAGAKHLIASYQLLREGGRIVLLINDTFNVGSKSFTLFKQYAPDHKLILNAKLDPSTFQKKGTSFETRIMVIEKSTTDKEVIPDTSINDSNIENILTLINQSHD